MEGKRNKRPSKRKEKDKRKRLFFLLLFIFIIVGCFLLFQYRVEYDSYDSIKPQVALYRDVIKGKGYLIFNEDVIASKGTGIAVYNVQEGEKVPKNHLIANVNLMQDNSRIKDELIQVQAAIDYKNDNTSSKEENATLSVEEVNIIRNIQKFVREESYEILIASINSLDLHTKHTVNISELNELLKLPLEDLENKKEKLSKELSTTDNEYRASNSGIISYQIDDIEKKLNYKNDFSDFTPSYLDSIEENIYESGKNSIKKGEPFYRIIDNLEWYVAMVIPDKRFITFEENSLINLKMEDGQIVSGKYEKYIGEDTDKGVILLQFQDKLSDFYLDRQREVTIIKNEFEAFTIPASSIIENEKGIRGVYIQEIHGLVQFIPVDIIGETREEVYVSRGDKSGRIKIGKKQFQTLSIHDNVIKNPEKVLPKQIVH